jgi:hypothetical protein
MLGWLLILVPVALASGGASRGSVDGARTDSHGEGTSQPAARGAGPSRRGTGAKVSVSLLENGRIELVAAAVRDNIKSLRGALRRSGQRPVSLEEMQEAIEAGGGR